MAAKWLGWSWPAAHYMVTREDFHLDFHTVCPYDVDAMARRDAANLVWEQWIEANPYFAELGKRPLFSTVRQTLRKMSPQHRAIAQAAVSGGHWTQDRSAREGMLDDSDDDLCQLCENGTGTARHRFYECERTKEQRDKLQQTFAHMARTSDSMGWTRCLLKGPAAGRFTIPTKE